MEVVEGCLPGAGCLTNKCMGARLLSVRNVLDFTGGTVECIETRLEGRLRAGLPNDQYNGRL